MTVPKNKVHWIDRGWQPVHIGYVPSEKAWKKIVKEIGHKGEPYPKTAGRCSFFPGNENHHNIALVVINPDRDYRETEILGLFVHEAVHVWQFCKEVMGEEAPGDEIEAYAIQAMSQHLLHAYEECHGKGK